MAETAAFLLIASIPAGSAGICGRLAAQIARRKIVGDAELLFFAQAFPDETAGAACRKLALRFSSRATLRRFLADFRSGSAEGEARSAEGVVFEELTELPTPEIDALSVLM